MNLRVFIFDESCRGTLTCRRIIIKVEAVQKMGANCCCSTTQKDVDERKLALAELDVLKLTTIPVEHIQRKNVLFSFRDGQMVSVRTFILSD